MRYAVIAFVVLLVPRVGAAQTGGVPVPADLLTRIGGYAEEYFRTAGTILSRETIRLQPVDGNLVPYGSGRLLVYELRIESAPGSALPAMTRRLVKASGELTPVPGEPDCFDPPDASIEPLAMLLPQRQQEFVFRMKEGARGRVIEIDVTRVLRRDPTVAWSGPCGSIDTSGSTRGRIWVEAATGRVLRVDERLEKPFRFISPLNVFANRGPISQTVDRFESSIRYEPVTFRDPDETLMLPKSARTLAVIYNGGVPRLLTLQSFDQYRRFVTAGRIVK